MNETTKRIISLQKQKGLNNHQLEVEANLQISSIQAWTKGKKRKDGTIVVANPSTDSIIKLAKFFNVSTDYLLGLTDESKTLSANENSSTELIKRPKYDVSDKFLEDYINLLKDKHFSNIAKIYNEFNEEYQIQIYTYIVTLATKIGLNVANILNK